MAEELTKYIEMTGVATRLEAEVASLRAELEQARKAVGRAREHAERAHAEGADLFDRAEQAERALEQAREALVRVRAHTSYTNTSVELLTGLLASIERIVDAALLASEGGKGNDTDV